MYLSASQKRIGSAVLVGAAVIALALYVRGTESDRASVRGGSGGDIVVTDAPDRTAIAITDSNGDGVPDWQESLVTNDSLLLNSFASTSHTAPDTLTEQFSQQFFESMVRSKTSGYFGSNQQEIVQNAAASLGEKIHDTLYSAADVRTTSDNSPSTLATYGELVAGVLNTNNTPTGDNELFILKEAVMNQDQSILAGLDTKIEVYRTLLSETKQLTVPTTVLQQHLNLLNAYQAVLTDITAMQHAFDDPMYALLRTKRYQDDVTGLGNAITNLYNTLLANNVSWGIGSVVYTIIKIQ